MKNQAFWGKLSKFVKESNSSSFNDKCSSNEDTKLTLSDGSVITSSLASTLLEEHNYFVSLMEKYDKECDYTRLLRKENFELMDYVDELEYSLSSMSDDGCSIEHELEEYLLNTSNVDESCDEENNTYKS